MISSLATRRASRYLRIPAETYATPTISACPLVTPVAGVSTFTVTGTGFRTVWGDNIVESVYLAGVAVTSFTVVSATSLTFVTSAYVSGPITIHVTTSGGSTSFSTLSVTSVSPTHGRYTGGTTVTVTGVGFTAGSTVAIGGVAATSVSVVSTTSLTCVTPAGSVGTAHIVVTNPSPHSQTSGTTGNSLYTYDAAPTVTSITPTEGLDLGGDAITSIAGTGFQAGAAVTIGGSAATGVVFSSSTLLTCVTAAGSAGQSHVIVTNTDGLSSNPYNSLFKYVAGPVTEEPAGILTEANVLLELEN